MNQAGLLTGKIEWLGNSILELSRGITAGEGVRQTLKIPDGTTDGSISLGGVSSGKLLVISSSQAISVKLNGSSSSLSLDADGILVLVGTTITQVQVTNASGSTAVLDIFILGD